MILPQCVGVGRISTNRKERGISDRAQNWQVVVSGKQQHLGVNEETYLTRVEN